MISFNKCVILALVASVLLSGALAASTEQVPTEAEQVPTDATQAAAPKPQDIPSRVAKDAQKAGAGLFGVTSQIYHTIKDTGSAILTPLRETGSNIISHIPYFGGIANSFSGKKNNQVPQQQPVEGAQVDNSQVQPEQQEAGQQQEVEVQDGEQQQQEQQPEEQQQGEQQQQDASVDEQAGQPAEQNANQQSA